MFNIKENLLRKSGNFSARISTGGKKNQVNPDSSKQAAEKQLNSSEYETEQLFIWAYRIALRKRYPEELSFVGELMNLCDEYPDVNPRAIFHQNGDTLFHAIAKSVESTKVDNEDKIFLKFDPSKIQELTDYLFLIDVDPKQRNFNGELPSDYVSEASIKSFLGSMELFSKEMILENINDRLDGADDKTPFWQKPAWQKGFNDEEKKERDYQYGLIEDNNITGHVASLKARQPTKMAL